MASLGNIYLKFGADVSQIKSGIQSVESQVSSFSKNISGLGKTIGGLFAGIQIANFGADAIKMSADIESSFLKIKNLTDTTTGDLEYFKTGIAEISGQVGRSQQELSKGLYAITSSGLVGKEALDALKISSQAAAIGMGDVNTIARSLSGVLLAYGKENITAARAAEILFQTLKFGNLEAEQLAPALGRILPTSSALGISMEQVGAGIAQISLSGADATQSVTYLKSILEAFSAPTEKANKVLEGLGLSMADVRDMAKNDLAGAIQFLNTKLGGNVEKIHDLLGRQEAMTGWFSLVGRNAEHYGEVVKGITADSHDFDKANAEVSQSSAQKWNVFTAQMANVKGAIGDALINFIDKLLPQSEEGTKKLNEALEKIPGSVESIGIQVSNLATGIQLLYTKIDQVLNKTGAYTLIDTLQTASKILDRIVYGVEKVSFSDINKGISELQKKSGFNPISTGGPVAKGIPFAGPSTVTPDYNPPKTPKVKKEDISFTNDFTKFEKELYSYQTALDEFGKNYYTSFEEPIYSGYNTLKLMSNQILDTSGTYDIWAQSITNFEGFADSSGKTLDSVIEKVTKAKETFTEFGEGLNNILSSGISESFAALGEQIGSVLSGGAFNFSSVLTPLADMLIQVGKLAIQTGIAMEGIKKALAGHPIAAIIGGIALVALGSFVKSRLGKINKFAKGAISYSQHLGLIGDNPNARFDPEVTAPSSKLKDIFKNITLPNAIKNINPDKNKNIYIPEIKNILPKSYNTSFAGGAQISLNGEFRINGTDLLYVLDRQKTVQFRQRGF